MKLLVALGLFVIVAPHLNAKNLPINSRTYGNFGPNIHHSFEVYETQESVARFGNVDPIIAATEFLMAKTKTSIKPHISSSHTSSHNGVTHVYFQQMINGLQVVNAVANVNVGKNGEIISYGNSFFAGRIPDASNDFLPKHSAEDARNALGKLIRMKEASLMKDNTENPPTLKYIQVNNGQDLALAWDIVEETKDNMYNAIVTVEGNQVVQLIDWVSDASYNVYPLGINDPSSGDRVIVKDPVHAQASPLGWHKVDENSAGHTTTRGNNVYAQENLDGGSDYINNYRPDGSAQLVFDHPINFNLEPQGYLDAAITNLFYWNNIIHDLFYVYGFDEKSGNFQENNFGRGGAQNDAVYANAQDGSGTNNANFMTPRDGQKGRMRMYIWTQTDPARDGDLDGGIVMHEYLHGISQRLTGGPNNVGCLGWGESGGMGEGWGDIFATITRVTTTSTRADVYQMGDYSNGGSGIRKFPYATDMQVNPSTYSYTTRPGYAGVHAKGEVWAVIIYDVFWNLVEKHGFDPDWFNNNPNDVKTEGSFKSILNGQDMPRQKRTATLGGNIIMFQLLVDGMKLQPCDPSFVEARDAIFQADSNNNNGENECELWKGFAKRGLGVGAGSGRDSFKIPTNCQ